MRIINHGRLASRGIDDVRIQSLRSNGGIAAGGGVWQREEPRVDNRLGLRANGVERKLASWAKRVVNGETVIRKPGIAIGNANDLAARRSGAVREIRDILPKGLERVGGRLRADEFKASGCLVKGPTGWTNVGEDALALEDGRDGLVIIDGLLFVAIFFGEEKESLVFGGVIEAGNIKRATDSPSGIILAIQRSAGSLIKEIAGVEMFVSREEVAIAMKRRSAGLGGGHGNSGSTAAVLGAVIGSQDLKRIDGIDARVHE